MTEIKKLQKRKHPSQPKKRSIWEKVQNEW
jgi:hypothetical protein